MIRLASVVATVALLVAPAVSAQDIPAAYQDVLRTLGKVGDFKDNVLKVNIPRNDLKVTVAGVPTVVAAVSDDRRARQGAFAVDFSSRAAVRLAAAGFTPAGSRAERAPRGVAPARLRALSLDGALYEETTAALAPAQR